VVYMLKDYAYGWWQLKEEPWEMRPNMSWEDFKKIFHEKYFLHTVRMQKEQEFWKLEQGDKTVAESEEEFTYSSKLAPHIVVDEEERACQFKDFDQRLRRQLI